MLRKFKNVGGFGDNTKYVVYSTVSRHFILEMKDGTHKEPGQKYHLDECLKFVTRGKWEEIKEPSCECDCSCEDKPKLRDYHQKRVDEMREYFKGHETYTQRMVKMFADRCACLEPIDFSTAQVGDTVLCLLNGDVKVTENEGEGRIPIETETKDWYDFSGHLDGDHKKPCLISFVDTDGNLCRTRPEPKIDWSKVAIDAPVVIRQGMDTRILHFAQDNGTGKPMFWTDGTTSHTAPQQSCSIIMGILTPTYKLINTEEK